MFEGGAEVRRLFVGQPKGDALDRLASLQQSPGVAKSQAVNPLLQRFAGEFDDMPTQLVLTNAGLQRQGVEIVVDRAGAFFPVLDGIQSTHSVERLWFLQFPECRCYNLEYG